MKMTVADIVNQIQDALEDSDLDIRRIETFGDAGLLTHDAGLVVRLKDGTEIQMTIQAYTKSGVELEDGEE